MNGQLNIGVPVVNLAYLEDLWVSAVEADDEEGAEMYRKAIEKYLAFKPEYLDRA